MEAGPGLRQGRPQILRPGRPDLQAAKMSSCVMVPPQLPGDEYLHDLDGAKKPGGRSGRLGT